MKYLNAILLTVVIIGTLGLFFLLGPEIKTTLFYANMLFSCFLLLLLFGTIIKVSGDTLFTVPNLAVAIQIKRYVLLAAFLMIAYNVLTHFLGKDLIEVKWYVASLILLTIIYVVIIIFVVQSAGYQTNQTTEIKEKTQRRLDLKAEHLKMINHLNRIASRKNFDLKKYENAKKSIGMMGDKAGIIPVAKIEQHYEKFESIYNAIIKLQADVENLEETTSSEEENQILERVARKADEISDNINLITKI